MSAKKPPNYEDLKARFEAEVRKGLKDVTTEQDMQPVSSQDYSTFRDSFIPPHQSLYEQACDLAEKIIKLEPEKSKRPEIERAIQTAHLDVSPAGVMSLSLLAPLAFMLIGGTFAMLLTGSFFLVFFFLIFGGLGILLFINLPKYFADSWRLLGSNQMIIAVFYIVTYMRHTSNFERAVEFAADHLEAPMSLDLKKVLWDVETGKYSEIFDSMEAYLDSWRGYNDEFIESMHLIEGSLLEESEQRRLDALDKSLDQILQRTYEKMLHYAHNLQSPITTLHMLGIILPILGLVILPLVVSFIDEARWYHIAIIYNVALPVVVYVMGKNILSKRPTGYGASDITNPSKKGNDQAPILFAGVVFVLLCIVGTSPLWLSWIGVSDFGFGAKIDPETSVCGREFCFLGYKEITNADSDLAGTTQGPFGLGAALISLAIPAAFCASIGLFYYLKTKGLLEIRAQTKRLEDEFSHALFTLGNRLGDGIPAEMAFGHVGESMPNTDSGNFMMLVSYNIQKLGMSVEQALFDKDHGAITKYPSNLIESSMKVLTQSAHKGPKVASQALMNISRYLDEVHKVNERLKDLMGEVISSMKSQINFLTPIIAGIVIGISSMISTILTRLSGTLQRLTDDTAQSGGINAAPTGLLDMFGAGIPTYYFQIIVGIYVVQIIIILTILVNGIENGVDPINRRHLLGVNMLKAAGLYIGVAFGVMVIFNMIAASILSSIG